MQREDSPGWSGVVSGYTVPTEQRPVVVRMATAAGVTFGAWMHHAVADRVELQQVAAMLGCSASELQARALRLVSRELGMSRADDERRRRVARVADREIDRALSSVDNGDEYGQRVMQHESMVRSMGK